MSLRRRLTLLAAGAVGMTVVLVSLVCYLAMRHELRGQIDDSLRQQGDLVQRISSGFGFRGGPPRIPALGPRAGGPQGFGQIVGPDGEVAVPAPRARELPLPVTDADRLVVAGAVDRVLSDRVVDGVHLRVLTARLDGGGAAQLARSLQSSDAVLRHLRIVLALLCIGGTALAAALGRLFSRSVIRPVADLTEAAEHISATEDLGRRVPASGDDEVGRMAERFNTMLDTLQSSRGALDDAMRAQRHLIADASHELRTPVTSLRTNIEVLLEGGALTDEQRARLTEDVREQTEELGALITDVIELARGDEPATATEDVAFGDLVAEGVTRARRHRPDVGFATEIASVVVEGQPDRLGRAVGNLLDNAAKYSPPGATVHVTLRADGELAVRDAGPGIPAEDLPHIFDRFYRGAAARGRHGSGLGLAIVRQVAASHAGTVTAEAAPEGGSLFRLRLPVMDAGDAGDAGDATGPTARRDGGR